MSKFFKDEKLAGTMRAASHKTVHEFHKLVQERDSYARMFYREVRLTHSSPRAPCSVLTFRSCASARSGTSTALTAS